MMSTLARASIDGAVVVAIVWLVTRIVNLSPATRTALWWCAAAKFVVALVWIDPILVPILPAIDPAASATPAAVVSRTAATDVASSGVEQPAAASSNSRERWSLALVGFWAIGCGIAGAIGLQRLLRLRVVIAESSPAPPAIQEMTAQLAVRLGLRSVPQVRVSDNVTTPLVAGPIEPTVLLPNQAFATLSDDQQRMVLCHELAHVKRGDLWLGCAPALAERAFFFHPLAHLAAREYSLWREAACDTAVLDALDAAPRDYGRLLLDLGVSRRRTGLAAAGAPWSFPNLKRRIVMLQESSARSKRSRVLSVAIVGLSAMAIVPVQLVARPFTYNTGQYALTPVGESAASPAAVQRRQSVEEQERQAASERNVKEQLERAQERIQELKRESGGDDLRFVAFFSDDQTTSSGEDSDRARARRYRKGREPMVWFLQDGREYVVRDPPTIASVQAAWKQVYEIGEQQGLIGAEQGKLGAQQGEIGALQGMVGAKQGEIGALQGRLAEEQAKLAELEVSLGADAARTRRAQLDRESRAIDARMKQLNEQMRELEVRLRELEKPMRELNEPMEELGRKMGVLGRRMEEEGHRARLETRRIFERAIASGAAQSVK
jgi:bla regulator protein blaR1